MKTKKPTIKERKIRQIFSLTEQTTDYLLLTNLSNHIKSDTRRTRQYLDLIIDLQNNKEKTQVENLPPRVVAFILTQPKLKYETVGRATIIYLEKPHPEPNNEPNTTQQIKHIPLSNY